MAFHNSKFEKVGPEWVLDIPFEEIHNQKYALYTGTEDAEEKEIIRNIFNNDWDLIPKKLRMELEKIFPNNLFGTVIKVIMITASGAEGISLKNVRYVHITEPYWHPVRIEQVIGRARRICSHKNLPVQYQTVKVFLYIMQFTEKQLTDNTANELVAQDKSKLLYEKISEDGTIHRQHLIFTSDQALYEISTIKEGINKEILHNIKEASIDCTVHKKVGGKEDLKCFTFNQVTPDKFSYIPNIKFHEGDSETKINKKEVVLRPQTIEIEDVIYIINANDLVIENEDEHGVIPKVAVYTLDSVKSKNPIQIGFLGFQRVTDKDEYKALNFEPLATSLLDS